MDRVAEIPLVIGFAFGGGGGGDAWIGLWGGLLGAIIGAGATAITSYVLQKREFDRQEQNRRDDRFERQRSVAHRMFIKLVAIQSDLERLHVHLFTQLKAIPAGEDMWPRVIAMFVDRAPIVFDGEETALLLDLGLHEHFNLVGALPGIRNQCHEVMINYEIKREALWAMLPQEAFTDTGVAMKPGLARQTLRLRTELEDLIKYLAGSLPESNKEAMDGLQKVHAVLADKKILQFKLDMSNSSLLKESEDQT